MINLYLFCVISAGTPLYQLDKQIMGCIFPIWAISTIVASAVIVVVIIIILNRKWEAIRFFMFMHFDILPKDDGRENLDEMEFDAFMTYRFGTILDLHSSFRWRILICSLLIRNLSYLFS